MKFLPSFKVYEAHYRDKRLALLTLPDALLRAEFCKVVLQSGSTTERTYQWHEEYGQPELWYLASYVNLYDFVNPKFFAAYRATKRTHIMATLMEIRDGEPTWKTGIKDLEDEVNIFLAGLQEHDVMEAYIEVYDLDLEVVDLEAEIEESFIDYDQWLNTMFDFAERLILVEHLHQTETFVDQYMEEYYTSITVPEILKDEYEISIRDDIFQPTSNPSNQKIYTTIEPFIDLETVKIYCRNALDFQYSSRTLIEPMQALTSNFRQNYILQKAILKQDPLWYPKLKDEWLPAIKTEFADLAEGEEMGFMLKESFRDKYHTWIKDLSAAYNTGSVLTNPQIGLLRQRGYDLYMEYFPLVLQFIKRYGTTPEFMTPDGHPLALNKHRAYKLDVNLKWGGNPYHLQAMVARKNSIVVQLRAECSGYHAGQRREVHDPAYARDPHRDFELLPLTATENYSQPNVELLMILCDLINEQQPEYFEATEMGFFMKEGLSGLKSEEYRRQFNEVNLWLLEIIKVYGREQLGHYYDINGIRREVEDIIPELEFNPPLALDPTHSTFCGPNGFNPELDPELTLEGLSPDPQRLLDRVYLEMRYTGPSGRIWRNQYAVNTTLEFLLDVKRGVQERYPEYGEAKEMGFFVKEAYEHPSGLRSWTDTIELRCMRLAQQAKEGWSSDLEAENIIYANPEIVFFFQLYQNQRPVVDFSLIHNHLGDRTGSWPELNITALFPFPQAERDIPKCIEAFWGQLAPAVLKTGQEYSNLYPALVKIMEAVPDELSAELKELMEFGDVGRRTLHWEDFEITVREMKYLVEKYPEVGEGAEMGFFVKERKIFSYARFVEAFEPPVASTRILDYLYGEGLDGNLSAVVLPVVSQMLAAGESPNEPELLATITTHPETEVTIELLKLLLEAGANPEDGNLFEVMEVDNLELYKLLLAAGTDAQQTTSLHSPATINLLMAAVDSWHQLDFARLAFNYGANPVQTFKSDAEGRDFFAYLKQTVQASGSFDEKIIMYEYQQWLESVSFQQQLLTRYGEKGLKRLVDVGIGVRTELNTTDEFKAYQEGHEMGFLP